MDKRLLTHRPAGTVIAPMRPRVNCSCHSSTYSRTTSSLTARRLSRRRVQSVYPSNDTDRSYRVASGRTRCRSEGFGCGSADTRGLRGAAVGSTDRETSNESLRCFAVELGEDRHQPQCQTNQLKMEVEEEEQVDPRRGERGNKEFWMPEGVCGSRRQRCLRPRKECGASSTNYVGGCGKTAVCCAFIPSFSYGHQSTDVSCRFLVTNSSNLSKCHFQLANQSLHQHPRNLGNRAIDLSRKRCDRYFDVYPSVGFSFQSLANRHNHSNHRERYFRNHRHHQRQHSGSFASTQKSTASCSSFLNLTNVSSTSNSSCSSTNFACSSSSFSNLISGLFFPPSGRNLLQSKTKKRKSQNILQNHQTRKTSSSLFSSSLDARLPFFLLTAVALIGLTLSGSQQHLRKQTNIHRLSSSSSSSSSAFSSSGSRRIGNAGVAPRRVANPAAASRQMIQVGFKTVLNETRDVHCPTVGGGEIPKWLSGHFLRHTPGTYGQENRPQSDSPKNGDKRQQYIDHLFDGLAMVSSYELRGGDVKFSNKYLETHGYKIWEHYGKDMSKSYVAWGTTFSKMNWTQALKWRRNFTEPEFYRGNPNVNFWRIGSNIQAVDESAHGLRFDIDTLETKETYLFDDTMLAPNYEYFEKVIHPAHEQVDLDGSVWNVMGVFTRGGNPFDQANWTVYRIEGDNQRVSVGSTPIGEKMFDLTKCFLNRHYPDYQDRAGYMHSFAMSRNYVVLPVVPYFLDYCTLFSHQQAGHGAFFRTYMQAQAAQGLKFHVMRKSDGMFVNTIIEGADKNIFVTHQINAFEDDGWLVVDMLTYKSTDVYQTAYIESIMQEVFANQEATIERFIISLKDFTLVERKALSKPQPMEFPTINYDKYRQRDYQFTYLITRPYLTHSTIMKLNVKTGNVTHWGPEEGVFPSEAVFVPTPGSTIEDDGVLLSGLLDAKFQRGFILVLNATTMEEISRARAPINTPFGLHNRFFSHAEMSTSSAASTPTIASPSYWPSFTSGDNIGKQVSAGADDDGSDDGSDDFDGVTVDKGGSSRKGPTQNHVPGVATAVIIFNISCLHVFSMLVGLLRHLLWP